MKKTSIAAIAAFGLGLTSLSAFADDTGGIQVHNATPKQLHFVCKLGVLTPINDKIPLNGDAPASGPREWNKAPLALLALSKGSIHCDFSDLDSGASYGSADISVTDNSDYTLALHGVPFIVSSDDGQKSQANQDFTFNLSREKEVKLNVGG